MGNGNFKVGDRVVVSERYWLAKRNIIGKTGTIIEEDEWAGIEFDSNIGGHSCNGEGKHGYCYYVPESDIDYVADVESHTAVIYRKGRETIATLKDGKNILKTAKATCNPSDKFNAEFGRALALARLNDDQKMIDWLLRGEENPFIPTQSRIVKQDKYEVGDKVKVREDLKLNKRYGQISCLKAHINTGKIQTVTSVTDNGNYAVDKSALYYSAEMFEGKIIEEPVTSGQSVTAPVITPFDWEGFKAGKFAVHCDAEEKAKQFFDELKMQGIKWSSCDELNNTNWSENKANTAYSIIGRGLVYGYASTKENIIPYTPNYREVKRPAKVGEWIKVVNASSFRDNKYKNGDVIKVTELISDKGISFGEETTYERMENKEYIVLEPITHPTETVGQAEPQYIEVKRRAVNGESVKVINADAIPTTNGKPDYKNGDIMEIIEGGYQTRYAKGEGDNGFSRVLNTDEYVVLEPVIPTIESIAQPEPKYIEVKRNARIGELIKIVKVGRHAPQLTLGDIHKVEKEDEFKGLHTDKRNVFNSGEHDEYVVLEPVNPSVRPTAPDLALVSIDALLDELRKRVK